MSHRARYAGGVVTLSSIRSIINKWYVWISQARRRTRILMPDMTCIFRHLHIAISTVCRYRVYATRHMVAYWHKRLNQVGNIWRTPTNLPRARVCLFFLFSYVSCREPDVILYTSIIPPATPATMSTNELCNAPLSRILGRTQSSEH